MLDELKEVKYFEEITDFKSFKKKTFEESSKSIGVFRTQASSTMKHLREYT